MYNGLYNCARATGLGVRTEGRGHGGGRVGGFGEKGRGVSWPSVAGSPRTISRCARRIRLTAPGCGLQSPGQGPRGH